LKKCLVEDRLELFKVSKERRMKIEEEMQGGQIGQIIPSEDV